MSSNLKSNIIQILGPLNHREAIERIISLDRQLTGPILYKKSSNFLLALPVCLLWRAQAIALNKLNDLVVIPSVWDFSIDMPSPPSSVADASKIPEYLDPMIQKIISSFAAWVLITSDVRPRCGNDLKLREVKIDIKLNHSLKVIDRKLKFKQWLGVDAQGSLDLDKYFKKTEKSKVMDGLRIIHYYEADITWSSHAFGKEPWLEPREFWSSELLNVGRLAEMFVELSDKIKIH